MLGRNPRQLGVGKYGEAYLSSAGDMVAKFASTFRAYQFALREARVMDFLKEVPGVQRVVGVCLEKALIVSRYAGPTLRDWQSGKAGRLPGFWLDIFAKVTSALVAIHAKGVMHNDLKANNICARKSATGGVYVTIIDFGMARRAGGLLHLRGG